VLTVVLGVTAAADLSAQGSGRALSLVVTHSTDSRSASQSSACLPRCEGRDVLTPLSLSAIEIELAWPLGGANRLGFDYHAGVVPMAWVRRNPDRAAVWTGSAWRMPVETERSSVLGIGVKPLGARLWAGWGDARLEADLSAGVFLFTDPLLAGNASRTNFTLEGGIGARFWSVAVGYRKHHISNAGLGDVNPGLDSNVIYLGVSF